MASVALTSHAHMWVGFGVLAAFANSSLAVNAIPPFVPHNSICNGSKTQSWNVDISSGSIQLKSSSHKQHVQCLCPKQYTLDARNNVTIAQLLPCDSIEASACWKIGTNVTIVQPSKHNPSVPLRLEAAMFPGECLTLNANVWPVPLSRNYQIQIRGCRPTEHWAYDGTTGEVMFDGNAAQCLDGGEDGGTDIGPRTCDIANVKSFPFCNSNLSHAARANDLVSRLNVSEIAGVLSMSMMESETIVGTTRVNQRTTQPIPRLNIPGFEFSEACHGVLSGCLQGSADSSGCPTSFTMPIGQAASFNESAWFTVAEAIAMEARALKNGGVNGVNFFAPNINNLRDPRWGRGYETAGEDALVNGRFAVHFVTGLQGDEHFLKAVATCKHSLLYDVEGGRFSNSLHASERDLTDYFLVPFEFCIKRAKVASIMCQYGAMDGTPSCANSKINNDVYRTSFGFDGYMVSDCDAVNSFKNFKKINVTTLPEASAKGITGGLDVDCGESYESLPEAVASGLVSEEAVRESASRFFAKQIALGALEKTSFDTIAADVVDTAAHRALAVDVAAQGLVLLRNEPLSPSALEPMVASRGSRGSSKVALPLSATAKLALIGPHADSTVDMLGNYYGVNLQVLNSSIKDVMTQHQLSFSYTDGAGTQGMAEAARIARTADVAVVCLGLTQRDEGEDHDRTSLGLPQAQLDLLANVTAVQPYTVVVLINGGALSIEAFTSGPHAVLAVIEAFYPGQGGGLAIVQALLGETNRFGKLPYTMYPRGFENRNVMNFDMRADGGLTYRFYNGKYGEPVYQFGHGLSYTTFTYTWEAPPKSTVNINDLKTNTSDCYDCSKVEYAVTVTNAGKMVGDAVILGFISTTDNETTVRSVFDFARVTLGVGASTTVTLRMDSGCKQAITSVDESGVRWVQPGSYVVTVGDIISPATHTLTVVGDTAKISASCAIN